MRRLQPQNVNTSEYWQSIYADDKYDLNKSDLKFGVIANHIEDGTRVLDLGCGVGELLDMIALYRPECNLFGLDHSPKAIATLQSHGIAGRIGDIMVEHELGEFDYVTCLETLEHVDEPQVLINQMARYLKKGGKAILTTPYLDHIPSSEHIWEFEYSDVEMMFKKVFEKVWVFPWGSGRKVINPDGSIQYPHGNWDTIFALGIK
jgi:2-polyprenyl-3-methyl-5-hydroxy-6-metoxy-1,4-benzoquinol methylase